MATEVEIKVIPSRVQPNPVADNFREGVPVRGTKYSEVYTQPMVRKSHALADEGAYFVTNNAQTGLAEANNTAFTAIAPFIIVQNTDSVGGRRIYLDYIALVTTAAGSAASGLVSIQAAVVVDTGLRYSSAGSNLTANIVNPNMDVSAAKSVATIYAGVPVATAATGASRTVCGLRILRPTVSGTVADVVGEMKLLNFGGVEGSTGTVTLGSANLLPQAFPPIVIGPQQTALIYIWQSVGATNVVASYAPELGWWER
jgi:hypothetical protein